ncbi:enoyl-CoA hydratase/isomerase family protein [Agromyces archimandritae]|uniref:enoyl-CoA hydratase n=1 Tax=Agromyces archimandritae TaxID=2781962 RepID=A0A975FQL2_9MICO|nr:enoyl-CoA hydratase/isomerase family protein [Agromyces archimandritae]QTX06017.1 enoyl-CoA hydratase/isomerase family protein [Agromyces archimandritae]
MGNESGGGTAGDGSVSVERRGAIALITLDRPRKRNALSTHLERELQRAISSEEVTGSRAVVITGEGGCFSAGADITELREMTPRAIADYYRSSGGVYEVVAALPQPVVAAITGYCLGGGLELALAADVRIADDEAVFGFPEIGIGILPSSGGVTRITRCVGTGRAADLVLRGRRFGAVEAERWGVVSEVAERGQALSRALDVAAEFAERDALALEHTKRVLEMSQEASLAGSLLLERLAYATLNRTEA